MKIRSPTSPLAISNWKCLNQPHHCHKEVGGITSPVAPGNALSSFQASAAPLLNCKGNKSGCFTASSLLICGNPRRAGKESEGLCQSLRQRSQICGAHPPRGVPKNVGGWGGAAPLPHAACPAPIPEPWPRSRPRLWGGGTR